jgi:hypothetical protein
LKKSIRKIQRYKKYQTNAPERFLDVNNSDEFTVLATQRAICKGYF